jgi:hypothetical protein
MSLTEVLQFILLPCVGFLLLNTFTNQQRLTRIETKLEDFIERCKIICQK